VAEDLAETILFVARLPASVCINEILMSPTWNRGYLSAVTGTGRLSRSGVATSPGQMQQDRMPWPHSSCLFVARLPASVCINEILMSPTWNRGYLEGVKL
jgi:hypothetical protein